MKSFRAPNTHHSATASCSASTSSLSGQRCSTHRSAVTRILTSQKPPRASGQRHRPRGPIRGAWKNPPGTFTRCVPFPLNPRWCLAQAVMFAQHLPAGWATLVWGCLVQEAGVLGLTRKDPDHLPDTAAKTASSQVGQVGVFSLSDPGWRLFCCVLAVSLEWQAQQHRDQLRRVSGLEFQIRPGTVGVAGTCTQYKRAKPPHSSRCPTPTTGSSFPISAVDSHSVSPSLAHARVCLPRHRSPLHHVRVDASRKCLPTPATAASPKFGSSA